MPLSAQPAFILHLRTCYHTGIYIVVAMALFVRTLIFLAGVTLLLGCLTRPCAAQEPPPASLPGKSASAIPIVRIPRVTRPPKIEDFLDGRPREAEAEFTGFRQYQPRDGTPVSQPTMAYLSYDGKNLYVGFVCKDEPSRVRARYSKREDIGSDDQVTLYLDTFHDRHRAYIFTTNPLGIQLDGITTEGQTDDYSFDTLWHSEGRLTSDGYVVWMAIPFKSLRFSNEEVQRWGIAVSRQIVRNNEVAYWPYVTQRMQGLVQQFATLEGLEHISPGRNVQLIPYGLFARARFLDRSDPNNPQILTKNDFRGGLDAKVVARDALTFDVTVNPDFNQVESDEPQVTINQRFEVFFPEKRPFFIENAGFFQTPLNLFFSRRIFDPQFGVRMTGKLGRWALGALAIDDRAPGNVRGERAAIGVLRVQREFGQQSKIGLFFSDRNFVSNYNRVLSLDTRLRLNPNWVLTGQIMGSFARQSQERPDCLNSKERLSGPAAFVELLRLGRHFNYAARYSDRSPEFCAALGFIPRVDIRQIVQFAGYTWRPKKGALQGFGPSVFTVVNWDRTGRVQDWFVDAKFDATLTGQTSVEVRRVEQFELFRDIGFRKHRSSLSFSTEMLKFLSIFADFTVGTSQDFFPGPGLPSSAGDPPPPLPPFLGNASSADAGFTLRPSPRFRFEQSYIFSRLATRVGSTPTGFAAGTAIFNNHILRSKLNYQFNRELSLRAIVDYNAVLPNPALANLERSKRLAGDLLLTYLLNPGTALYIGYTDGYENLVLDPGVPKVNTTQSVLHSTGRQFFVKLSYLFRF